MIGRIVIVSGACGTGKTTIEAIAASAKRFSESGYEVYIDGVIGPWFLTPWIQLAQDGFDVRYLVLRPDMQTTVSRALEREQQSSNPLKRETIETMWYNFSDLNTYETNVVDTTAQTIDESILYIQNMLLDCAFFIL